MLCVMESMGLIAQHLVPGQIQDKLTKFEKE